jgi:hypothetical protein
MPSPPGMVKTCPDGIAQHQLTLRHTHFLAASQNLQPVGA